MLTKIDYEWAIQAQNACNATGVVYSLHGVMSKLIQDHHLSTDEVNQHPIVILYLNHINFLAGLPMVPYERFNAAMDYCLEQIEELSHD